MIIMVYGKPVTLTQATIDATRKWFADNSQACINEVLSGEQRVNNPESYIAWRKEAIEQALRGDFDRSLAFIQRAVALQTGECVPILA